MEDHAHRVANLELWHQRSRSYLHELNETTKVACSFPIIFLAPRYTCRNLLEASHEVEKREQELRDMYTMAWYRGESAAETLPQAYRSYAQAKSVYEETMAKTSCLLKKMADWSIPCPVAAPK